MSVKIHIVYCGGRGYAPKFRKIKQELEAKFGDKVEVTGEGTPDTTGYLEVEIVGGAVLHSKKNGDGYVDTSDKMNRSSPAWRRLLPKMPRICKRDQSWTADLMMSPMDMIEEEVENENLMIENNTVPLLEDTTNIMEMIENASFDFTLPEPIPSTTLHIEEQKLEVEQMVEVIDNNTETVWAGLSFDDANLGLCLPAIEAEGRIELPVDVANNNNNNVESSESDDLLKWIMDDTQIADFAFPDEVEQATTSFLIEEVKTEEVEEAEEPPKVKRSRIKIEEPPKV